MIAPPNEEYKKKPPNPFKRASRQNHDTCDSCNEAGNLICCDYCCASFHLTCHDPPLEEHEIPSGLFLCHTCKMKEKISKEKEESRQAIAADEPSTSSAVAEPQQDSTEPIVVADVEMKSDEKESESTTPAVDSDPMQVSEEPSIDPDEPLPEPTKEEEEPLEPELSPFEELIRVASLLNPKQFELPIEMTEPFPFPGTERAEQIKNGRRVKNKRLIELDTHGCVTLPAKLCFSCNKSCKRAPLISCDYCTLYFHQDCLDPPMTALPAGRWMCPNHPQHFIVSIHNARIFLHFEAFLCCRIGIWCHLIQLRSE